MIGKVYDRLLLSRAKHPSVSGHAKWSQRLARLVPYYDYPDEEIWSADGAPPMVAARRRAGFEGLAAGLSKRAPRTIAESEALEEVVSDLAFVNAYRVPFQFRRYVGERIGFGAIALETMGARVCDLDGNWSYDLGGSYGVNLFGHEFYKRAMSRAVERARDLGMTLGSYHPIVGENARRLVELSGQDEVSFHMSGTEAVMQAVRLARYHTRRSHVVRFCGAYHGWWDGVQAGVGNPRPPHEVYTLKEMDSTTLRVLRTRSDIACVLVNPIQAMHPNGVPPSDGALVAGDRSVRYDKLAYAAWLKELRRVTAERGIVLVLDDVFLGFRLARGGSQDFFGVRADLVTYGKSLGGGFPVGVVCGRRDLMRRSRPDRPADVCLARGTFNAHPCVMTAMNEFLRYLDEPDVRASYASSEALWDVRARALNDALAERGLPVRIANMVSVWTTTFRVPSRYCWMLQFYLRAEGLALPWIGSGRFVFPHDLSDEDFAAIASRFVAAASAMEADGLFWCAEGQTSRSIRRQLGREMAHAAARRLLGRAPSEEPKHPPKMAHPRPPAGPPFLAV